MMTRAWLILADGLLVILLLLSFFLFYLGEKTTQNVFQSDFNVSQREHLETISHRDYNSSISLEALIAMENDLKEEYILKPKVEDPMITRSMDEALKMLEVKMGAPLFIRIFKEEALLEVWVKKDFVYAHLKSYRICAYSGSLGPKVKEGDFQSPEGFYKVSKKLLNPNSKFHLSFNLGYPNAYDRAHERTGSFLMVHGNCVSEGCYAMTDEKIEEIYTLLEEALEKGQKFVSVHAYPFKMTEENMALYEGNEWYDFWVNLKEGYDYFEDQKYPPKIKVKEKRYEIFEN